MNESEAVRQTPAPARLVFVVDDDPMLVELATLVLEGAGYTVQQFLDPRTALKALPDANPVPGVLVTDYQMAGMNGLDLILASQKFYPNLKTILLSGSVDASITEFHGAKVHRFLHKPYDTTDLVKAVAELME